MKTIISFIAILVLLITLPIGVVFAETTFEFAPEITSGLEYTPSEWLSAPGELCILLMLDFQCAQSNCTDGSIPSFEFDANNEAYLIRSGTILCVGFYEESNILLLVYDTMSQRVVGVIDTFEREAMARGFLEFSFESFGNYRVVDSDEITDALVFVKNAFDVE